jgi:hypothetical protein
MVMGCANKRHLKRVQDRGYRHPTGMRKVFNVKEGERNYDDISK